MQVGNPDFCPSYGDRITEDLNTEVTKHLKSLVRTGTFIEVCNRYGETVWKADHLGKIVYFDPECTKIASTVLKLGDRVILHSFTNPQNLEKIEDPAMTTDPAAEPKRSRPRKIQPDTAAPAPLTDAQETAVALAAISGIETPTTALNTDTKWLSPEDFAGKEAIAPTQIRDSLDFETVDRYAEMMIEDLWDFQRSPLPVVFEFEGNHLVGDGHHRVAAAAKIGADILCEIFTASRVEDAILYSVRAIENSNHGLPLRPKDQRKRIEMFLGLLENMEVPLPQGFEIWSSRAIAKYLNLPESGYRTVASIRATAKYLNLPESGYHTVASIRKEQENANHPNSSSITQGNHLAEVRERSPKPSVNRDTTTPENDEERDLTPPLPLEEYKTPKDRYNAEKPHQQVIDLYDQAKRHGSFQKLELAEILIGNEFPKGIAEILEAIATRLEDLSKNCKPLDKKRLGNIAFSARKLGNALSE